MWCIYTLKPTTMKSIMDRIHRLNFEKRHSIMVRQDTLDKINKVIGAAMYHEGRKVGKSDIIAHAVDYLYDKITKELAKSKA